MDEKKEVKSNKGFITELWDSIFTPGTSPALIKATHGSFIILMAVFAVLIAISKPAVRFHFINLLAITIAFYLVVVWFIKELHAAQAAEEASKKQI